MEQLSFNDIEDTGAALTSILGAFDNLPAANQPGGDLWQRYDELIGACKTIRNFRDSFVRE